MLTLSRLVLNFGSDLRFSWRRLRRSPLFAITTVATFALGIAANTAIFSVMDALVLRPLAVPQLNHVVSVAEQWGGNDASPVSLADYRDYAAQSRSFVDLAARTQAYMALTLGGQSEHVQATRTTANLFAVYRMQPQLGRLFAASEDQPGHEGEAVLTHAFWQSHFGGSDAVLGRDIVLDGRPYSIIGVMPRSFDGVGNGDLYLPLAATAAQGSDRQLRNYTMVGRLREGSSVATASAELNGIALGLARQFPRTNEGWKVRVRLLVETINGDLTPFFMHLVFAATLLLMVVVCANVSNLQFAYLLRRTPELAMRFALGSTRGRLLRELLLDSLLQSLLGATLGIALSAVALHFILAEMPARVSRLVAGWSDIRLDSRALMFSVAVAVIAGLVAGVAPALAGARMQLLEQLKSGGRSVSGSRRSHRLRNVLSIAQITLATALVAGAVCIAASISTMLNAAGRFQPEKVLMFHAYLPAARYETAPKQSAFFASSLDRLRALPGVRSAVFATALPYNNEGVWWQRVTIPGDPALPGQTRNTQRLTVSPDFFSSFGLRTVQGRSLASSDTLDHPLVAVVSRRFAAEYFGTRDPIGRQIQLGKDTTDLTPPATIVGVVEDVIYTWVDQVPQPAVYFSAAQMPSTSGTFVLRTEGDPLSLAVPARRALANLDSTLPVDTPETYATYVHESFVGLSYMAVMLAADAAIALFLSGIGLFGVMANLVTERTHEIGIRFAVGAGRGSILALLMRRTLALTSIGLGGGVVLAVAVGRVLTGTLQNVRAEQGQIILGTGLLVVLISLLAGYIPARRATEVDPVEALRAQ